MVYTPTNFSSVTNLQTGLELANTNSGGYFWTSMVMMVFMILFITLLNFGFEASLLSSAFLGFLLAFFLAYIGLVAWWLVGVFVAIMLFTIFYIMWGGRNN